MNMADSFDVTPAELTCNHIGRVVATSCTQIIEEVLTNGRHQNADGAGRLILHLKELQA